MTLPERFGLLGAGVVAAALAWPTITEATGVGLPCPLRTVIGIPCPLCGMTTASVALVRGDVGVAVAANPLVIALAAFTVAMAVVMTLRATGLARPRGADSPTRPAFWALPLVAAAVASEAWQLSRFGLL